MKEETLRDIERIGDGLEHLPGGGSMLIRQLCAEVRRLRAALKYVQQQARADNPMVSMRLGECEREASAALEGGG